MFIVPKHMAGDRLPKKLLIAIQKVEPRTLFPSNM